MGSGDSSANLASAGTFAVSKAQLPAGRFLGFGQMIDRATIEAQFNDRTLLTSIAEGKWYSSDGSEIDEFVALHTAGTIDLLAVLEWDEFNRETGHDFFVIQHFFNKAIPKLGDLPVKRLMASVAKLVANGGNDGAAGQPNAAFREWCSMDVTRADDVIALARSGDDLAIDHLAFALEAKKDPAAARAIAQEFPGKMRLFGLTALSRIAHADEDERARTIAKLPSLIDDVADDAVRSSVLMAAINPFETAGVPLTAEALDVVRLSTRTPGPFCVHQSAQLLWNVKACRSPELIEVLVASVAYVDPSNKGTLDVLDMALERLLNEGNRAIAIGLLRTLVLRTDQKFDAGSFDSFARSLVKNGKALPELVIPWLGSGEPRLCNAVSTFLKRPEEDRVILDLDFSGYSETQIYFICRKSIGYMFLQPVTATSVLVSALRGASEPLADGIVELLFDPMLTNYGGELRRYLEAVSASDPAYAGVQKALERQKAYVEGLEKAENIPELHPSEYRRQLERIRQVDFNREVNRKAHLQSIFRDIVRRSVLLHGSGSVTFVDDGAGGRRPISMQMHPHEYSVEWPRMEVVDPVGRDFMIRTFRAEKLKL